jgi:predicted ABC-type sugar transport system permease subunit
MNEPAAEKRSFVDGIVNWVKGLLSGKTALGGILTSTRRRWVDYLFLLAFFLLILVAASMSDVFFTSRNISNLLRQIVTNGLISLGMLVVILTGGIDLSVGAVVAFASIVASGMIKPNLHSFGNHDRPCGRGLQAFNGYMISRFKLQPFIVTLATLGAIRGLVYVYSQTPITPQEPTFRTIFGTPILGPFTLSVLIMLLAFVVAGIFLNRTTAGRAIVAVGGNEEAVRLAGISVHKTIFAHPGRLIVSNGWDLAGFTPGHLAAEPGRWFRTRRNRGLRDRWSNPGRWRWERAGDFRGCPHSGTDRQFTQFVQCAILLPANF